ncbi:hypothetical protein PWG71_03260 [Nocardiopsis sp. N85]|uniref:hypothetical protein n=1 Tax=Nocardiopsis sp. N85 TaxID=3029400 RepID=UPI00237F9E47|nr:hypothetical protein [Nocardiopsis sp. N85]MDE3720391.1 hypothetical protein [Nocardiopsis sp. N85]
MSDAPTRVLPVPGEDPDGPDRPEFAYDPPTGTSPEVTRLMCLAAYLDAAFRRVVLNRLVDDPRRVVAPSYGFDLVPVIAHCLRARDIDEEFSRKLTFARGVCLFTLTIISVLLVVGWFDIVVRGRESALPLVVMVVVLLALCVRVGVHFLPGDTGRTAVERAREADLLFLPWLAWRDHRERIKRILARELSEETFTGGPPVQPSTKHGSLLRWVAREQHSALIPYRLDSPFRGAGLELNMWSLALELRRRGADTREETGRPLDERAIVDLIRPQLESLTLSAAGGGRDRLGALEISECVFLPGTLPHGALRSGLPVGAPDDARVADHLRAAVAEGGEQRRHFLRIRVGGWDEQVVVTVFVRVHTQGGVLLLEIVPYLLAPLNDDFHVVSAVVEALTSGVDVDDVIDGLMSRNAGIRKVLDVLSRTSKPGGSGRNSDDEDRRIRGPVFSVRQYAAGGGLSHFQRMDVIRYVKTIELRIAEGVNQALEQAGYETEEFRRRAVHLGNGAVFVGGSMTGGAISTGSGSHAEDNSTDGSASQSERGST